MSGRVAAIVVAAGEGRRFGTPKQFALIGGRRVLDWSVEGARAVASLVVLVVPRSSLRDPAFRAAADVVVPGGATRADSVRAGLGAIPEDFDVVVVHDAARPLATPALFRAVVAAVHDGAAAAIPGLPVSDTVKRVSDGLVAETVDRSEFVLAQTPQAFRLEALRSAHATMAQSTDDAGLVEASGARVVVVPGEPRNIKLTTPDDLTLLETWGPA
ncbi:MAG TPA: 2-C-methyl-D-erythritol 4-phosphate cytidylyltransferase [Acidimicrobiales bacterium]|nr:2-C-methyl-D-erythritol 4-phosphate cytidylyltransferase [Acidimicrobiales bacterium]